MSEISRKSFLKLTKNTFAVLGLGAVAAPVIAYFFPAELEETPSAPVSAGKVVDLPEGKATKVAFGRYPAIVVHTKEGVKAYSAVCTHFACICKWEENLGQIVCPCHEGYFDPIDGQCDLWSATHTAGISECRDRQWQHLYLAPEVKHERRSTRTKEKTPFTTYLKDFFVNILGQVRILKITYPGIMHFLIFWGSTLLVIGHIVLLMQMALFLPFALPFPRGNTYLIYETISDFAGLALLLGILMALIPPAGAQTLPP